MNEIITCNNISKKFKNTSILKNVSLNIYKGECIALLGQNGAGKTTLLNMILGDIKPTSGNLFMAYQGLNLGILTQETKFPDDIKVIEILKFVSSFSSNSINMKAIKSILNFSEKQLQQMAGELSGGQKRILDFCLTILNKPKLLIVDEPTSGMDTVTRKRFWNIMKKLKEDGTTILFTTHYVEEVDYVSDRVLVLNKGKLVANDSPFHLRTLDKKKSLTFDSILKENYLNNVKYLEKKLKKYIKINLKNGIIVWEFDDKYTKMILSLLLDSNIDISSIELNNSSLLDMIFNNKFNEDGK